jgi:putative SOS response-associated peptidase YedK
MMELNMCGRVRDPDYDEFSDIRLNPFSGQWIWNWKTQPRRYNVPPHAELPVVRSRDGARYIDPMRWGLLPSWAKDSKIGLSTINARADRIETKASYSGSWHAGRRCLVITGGFYEWRKVGVADKQPFAIGMDNGGTMAFAGLWEAWKDPGNPDAERIRTFTIITTEPNDLIATIHDRMPVILDLEDWPKWLGEEPAKNNELKALLRPFPSKRLAMWLVDRKVGNVTNEGADLISALSWGSKETS